MCIRDKYNEDEHYVQTSLTTGSCQYSVHCISAFTDLRNRRPNNKYSGGVNVGLVFTMS